MSTRENTKATLEAMLDGGHTVGDIVSLLSEVCLEKAEWVESPESVGEPDKPLGRAWRAAARILNATEGRILGSEPISRHMI